MAIKNKSALATGLAAATLALGWSLREAQWARAQGMHIPNTLVNQADVKMDRVAYERKPSGKAGVYLDGSTAGTRSMQVGRFVLDPGAQPHAPHRHADEEILIVTRGTGQIVCDGKNYEVKPGAVMYADPNVEHGIKNTGARPLEFYWVKYVPGAK